MKLQRISLPYNTNTGDRLDGADIFDSTVEQLTMLARHFYLMLLAMGELSAGQRAADKDFTLADYAHARRDKRALAIEFFDFFGNFTGVNGGLPNVTLPDKQDLKCLADLAQLSQAITTPKLWAMRFIDAWGALPSGILYSNMIDLGNYDECLNINKQISPDYNIQGQYCLAKLPLGQLLGLPLSDVADVAVMQIAICVPASCSSKRIDKLLRKFLQEILSINLSVDGMQLVAADSCQTSARSPLGSWAIATITILSTLGALVLLSTLYDYFCVQAGAELPACVRAFSARANGRQLFRVVTTSNPNVVPCLHGMRCLSLIWVVYGHSYDLALQSPNLNNSHMFKWIEAPYTAFVLQATFSVDTFFFLSGLLVCMLTLREMDRTKGRLNVPLMYLHRYLRLTPVLAIGILMYCALLPHMADGPLWGVLQFDDYTACQRNWWATLLYVQNYAVNEVCIVHSWYLAVDMQLYIISPIFLFALWKWGKKAVAGIVVLILLLSVCLFSMMLLKHYTLFYKHIFRSLNSQKKIYFATQTRAAPFLIGLIFGYFLHKSKSNGQSFKLSKPMVWLGWLLALALIFTVLYAIYPKSKLTASDLTSLQEASYLTLSRIAWPLALCWVVFACQYGYGGLADGLLSSPLWQPLSKLSYCVYIFHIFIGDINTGRTRTNTYFSDYDVMLKFWSLFGFSVLLATLIYLLIEAPMAGLEMMLLANRRATSATQKLTANNPSAEQTIRETETETPAPPAARAEAMKAQDVAN